MLAELAWVAAPPGAPHAPVRNWLDDEVALGRAMVAAWALPHHVAMEGAWAVVSSFASPLLLNYSPPLAQAMLCDASQAVVI